MRLAALLLLLLRAAAVAWASEGDEDEEFWQACVPNCELTLGCAQALEDDPCLKARACDPATAPLALQLTLWTCEADCK